MDTNIICPQCGQLADAVARSERNVMPDRTFIRRWRKCANGHTTATNAVETEEVVDDLATSLVNALEPVEQKEEVGVAF